MNYGKTFKVLSSATLLSALVLGAVAVAAAVAFRMLVSDDGPDSVGRDARPAGALPATAVRILAGATDKLEPQPIEQFGIYVARADGTNLRRLTVGLKDYWPVWSPRGEQLAFARRGEGIYLAGDAPGEENALTAMPVYDYQPFAWSPDGKRIAFHLWPDLFVASLDGHEPVNLTEGRLRGGPGVDAPSWAPDSQRFVVARGPGLHIFNVGSKQVKRLTSGDRDFRPAWSPDGSLIAFSRGRAEFRLYAVRPDGGGLRKFPVPTDSFNSLAAWSPDGKRLAFWRSIAGDSQVIVLNVSTGAETVVQAERAGSGYSMLRWSPDGKKLLLVRVSGNTVLTANSDGSGFRELFWARRGIMDSADWSPDGQSIAFAVWDPAEH